jgi:hypothetical protein
MSKQGLVSAAIAIAFALVALAGCTEDPLFPTRTIEVTATDVPLIEGDAVYELWLSYPSERANPKQRSIDHELPEYFSAGRFRVDAAGALVGVDGGPAAFAIPSGYNPSLIAEAMVSVEPRDDDDTIPDAVMLSGDFYGTATRGHAILMTTGRRAFDSVALSLRGGRFVLEAPTSPRPEDALSGIWFILHQPNQTTGDTISPGLSLTAHPLNHDNDNWTYESWLTARNGDRVEYISLGRFRSPASADDNGPGPGAGSAAAAAYPFPGEDFVSPTPRRLNDTTYGVVVSMQPQGIALSAPLVRLLERPSIPADAGRDPIVLSQTARLPIIEVTIVR